MGTKKTTSMNLTAIVNTASFSVESIFSGNKEIEKKISIEEFIKKILNDEVLSKAEGRDVRAFFNKMITLKSSNLEDTFNIRIKNTTLSIIFSAFKIDEDKYILTISNDKKNYDEKFDKITKSIQPKELIENIQMIIERNIPFVLFYIDIDNFSKFNDSYGFMYGDILLIETVAAIKKVIGTKGLVSRIGGNRFLVVNLIDGSYENVYVACKNLREAITSVNGHNIKQANITATVGCASFPQDGNTFDILFKKCDKALIRGKGKGKNCFIIYDESKSGAIDDVSVDTLFPTEYKLNHGDMNSNIVAAIFEILNRGGKIDRNLEDALSLIGNYFLLDRITLTLHEPGERKIKQNIVWMNPRTPESYTRPAENAHIPLWLDEFDQIGMIRINDLDDYPDESPIKPILMSIHTSSCLIFKIEHMTKLYGIIHFNVCDGNTREWTDSDIACLMLISKTIAIYLNKNHEAMLYKKELHFDKLTEIYNYSKWREEVSETMGGAQYFVHSSFLSLYIHGYKHLNDVYGFKYCDDIVKKIANAIKEFSVEEEIYCRVSDDKFIIFIPHQNVDAIKIYFNNISKRVEEIVVVTTEKIKVCGGLYLHNGLDELTTAIDKVNLTRKHNFSQAEDLSIFSDTIFEQHKLQSELELHMQKAKENGEFLLYLQPKVDTKNSKTVGAEALTRWNFKNQKLIFPNVFIPLFERNGFINELDFQVFENVCKFQRQCMDEGYEPLKISVNVSRYQQDFNGYISKINSIRDKYQVEAKYIEIEITEGMYVENTESIGQFIKSLHSYGYKVSMDDFGSGYSNLSSLATLDFDLLKLDKGFCSDTENQRESIILSFVMSLAKKLKIDVLCEGVETKDLADYLAKIGCTLIQGYLFDKPLPADVFKKKYIENVKF